MLQLSKTRSGFGNSDRKNLKMKNNSVLYTFNISLMYSLEAFKVMTNGAEYNIFQS